MISVAAASRSPTCLITVLKALFTKLPHDSNTSLFEQPNGKALSYSYFISTIHNALLWAGLNPKLYTGYSFRHGAASAVATAGYEIQLLGRWRSDSYKLYIKNNSA